MHESLPPVTYELQLRFRSELAALAKRATLQRLAEAATFAYADGVVDGVETPLADGRLAELAAGNDDTTPILVWDYDRTPLSQLATELSAQLGESVTAQIVELATAAWQSAWDQESGDAMARCTARFRLVLSGPVAAESRCADGDLLPIYLPRAQAFGDGRHATTIAALRALEALPPTLPRAGALDVGAGTGVLAIAAARLGFSPIVATEICGDALADASANAAANGISLIPVLADVPPPPAIPYGLILANILVPVLHQLLPVLAAQLAANGVMVLTGFIDKDTVALTQVARRHGLTVVNRAEERGWVALVLVPG